MSSKTDILYYSALSAAISIPLSFLISYGIYKVLNRKQEETEAAQDEQSDSDSSSECSWEDEESYAKMVLVVRNDLKMGKGKVAAQCAHAAVGAYKEAKKHHKKQLKAWSACGQTKIALRCDSEAEMLELYQTARAVGLLAYIVRDAGQTQVAPGSKTVLAVGPGVCELIDQITGHLKLY